MPERPERRDARARSDGDDRRRRRGRQLEGAALERDAYDRAFGQAGEVSRADAFARRFEQGFIVDDRYQ